MIQLDPLGPVTIGAREIYDQLLDTDRKVDGIRGEVQQVAQGQGELAKDLNDHENRLRTLEGARWPLPSAAVLLSLAGLVLALITFMQKGG